MANSSGDSETRDSAARGRHPGAGNEAESQCETKKALEQVMFIPSREAGYPASFHGPFIFRAPWASQRAIKLRCARRHMRRAPARRHRSHATARRRSS